MKLGSRRNKFGKKRKFSKKRHVIFVIFVLLSSSIALMFYSRFFEKKTLFISPIASNNQDITKALNKLLSDSEIEFSSVVFRSPSSYLVKLKEDGEAILSLHKDFKKQIASLQAVLKQLTIEGKRVIRIDFRFDKPVIEVRE